MTQAENSKAEWRMPFGLAVIGGMRNLVADPRGGCKALRLSRWHRGRRIQLIEICTISRVDGIRMIRTEAELDKSAGIGSEPGLPALVGLELQHCGLGARVPLGGRFATEIVLPNKGLLDRRNAV